MFDEVLVCLDGSSLAESILPLARAITAPKGGNADIAPFPSLRGIS